MLEFASQALAAARKAFHTRAENAAIKSLGAELGFRIEMHYQRTPSDTFSQLCDIYGSDKGDAGRVDQPYPWESHTYSDYVSRIFGHCRLGVLRVFECGIGTNNPEIASSMGPTGVPGASLRVWRDYFVSAQIFGGDIVETILFEEERIRTFKLDQTDPRSIREVFETIGGELDIIIDDGLHEFDAGKTLFENSFKFLSDTGIYIIEDVSASDCLRFHRLLRNFGYSYEIVNLYRRGLPLENNSMVVIRKSL